MAYLSNFEEVGSVNNTGARSEFPSSTFTQLVAAERGGASSDLDLRRALHQSLVISADANDGSNPVFPETSEHTNAARVGYGVVIKLYVPGFDAPSEFTAQIRGLMDRNSISWQTHTLQGGRRRRHDRAFHITKGYAGDRSGCRTCVDACSIRDVIKGRCVGVLPNDVCVRFAVTKRALALVAEGVCGFPAARLVVRAERKHTHRGARNVLPPGEKLRKLDFDAPETWVRLLQGYTNVPRLMAAPNHLGCGGTPRL